LFCHYPEHLVAEAIDPVYGLPAECEFLPTIAKIKSYLEPRWLAHCRTIELKERHLRKRLPEPERDLEADKRMAENFRQLGETLKAHRQ
jgi:hypothetical protein